jgi:hypothetical protein
MRRPFEPTYILTVSLVQDDNRLSRLLSLVAVAAHLSEADTMLAVNSIMPLTRFRDLRMHVDAPRPATS